MLYVRPSSQTIYLRLHFTNTFFPTENDSYQYKPVERKHMNQTFNIYIVQVLRQEI